MTADPVPFLPPANTDAVLVQAEDLHFSVGGQALLTQVSLELHQGELLVILGRNGAGKSTLLRHLTGDLGRRGVQMFGQPLVQHPPAQLARRRAVLPQQTPSSFAYEVLDVVLLGRLPHGRAESEADRAIAAACLARVGLGGYESRTMLTLSGGEQQRVHLARVLAQLDGTRESRVLLLDEPTASLDLPHQHATLRLARQLCAEGVGVLAILHDLNLAAQYADRVLLLDGGQRAAYGTPQEVLTAARIQAVFGHEVLVTRHPCLNCPLIVSAG